MGKGCNFLEDCIPRKKDWERTSNKGSSPANTNNNPKNHGGIKQKLYQRSALYSPQFKNTHTMDQCRKWDKNKNPMDWVSKQIHAHKKESADIMACFA